MNRPFAPLETIDISCLGGLRFVDRASGRPIVVGLRVTVSRKGVSRPLAPSPSGCFALHRFPGFKASERWDGLGYPPAPAEPFQVSVIDTSGDFLSMQFPSRLPVGKETGFWCATAPGPILPVPLYSSPSRRSPAGFQRLRGWLVDRDTGQPGPWARIRVTSAEAQVSARSVLGEGMTDENGSFLVPIRTPTPDPAPALAPGPPPPLVFRIIVEAGASAGMRDALPDLCDVLARPAVELLARLPAQTLAAQEIKLGQELILQTLRTSNGQVVMGPELFFAAH